MLGFVMLASGVAKLLHPHATNTAVSLLIPSIARVSRAVTRILASLEVGLGMCLLLPFHMHAAAKTAVVLLICLTLALAQMRSKPALHRCGCFGMLDGRSIGPVQFARNASLLALALALAIVGDLCPSTQASSGGRWPIIVGGGLVTVVAGLLYVALSGLQDMSVSDSVVSQ